METWEHLQHRLRSLLRRRAYWVLVALTLLACLGLWAERLVGVLGFPNALALNVLFGPAALILGVMAGRMERVIAGPEQPRWLALYLLPAKNPRRAVLGAWGAALGGALLLLAGGLGVALLGGLVLGSCEILRGLAFYPVLVLPSLALGTISGVALTLLDGRRRILWPAMVAVLGASLAFSAWPVVLGPQAFVFNHFLGHVPGPIYDERIALTGALLAYRGLTLLWTGVVAALAMGLCDAPRFALRRWQPDRRVHVLLLACALGALTLYGLRHRVGFTQSFASLQRELGGTLEVPGLVIHYPAERDPAWVERLRADHVHDRKVLLEWLAIDPSTAPVIHSYVFRSTEEKARLTGAGGTSIAKPWQSAVFLDDRGYPHPVLRHELAHALTAGWSRSLFGVPGGLLPNAGLVEGVAVAATHRAQDLTLHQWARAMREIGVAPDIRGLFSTYGFWRESGSRAYTLAGSFIRWLAEAEGIDAVRRAYAAGDLAVLGDPEPLFAAWEASLDLLPLPERALRLAEDRFRRPGILRRPCAFDVQALRREGEDALRAGDGDAARRAFERCAKLEPDDPAHLEALLQVALQHPLETDEASEPERAGELLERLLAHPKTGPQLKTRVQGRQGDEAWRAGDLAAADEAYAEALETAARDDERRLLSIKRWAMVHPGHAPVLFGLFLSERARDLLPLTLHEHLATISEDEPEARALFAYLLGRQIFNRREFGRALRWFEEARDLGLPPLKGFALENLRLIAQARDELSWSDPGQARAAADAWQAVLDHPGAPEVDRLEAADRRDRLLSRVP
ncbi:MAG: hypothetical protein P1V51_20260 [Deltaproteobacteria bacterium]|nr:hypothetical protein [Deltaproteobacteria bacterium]